MKVKDPILRLLYVYAGVFVSVTLISSAVALHSKRFDGRSVDTSILITLGVLAAITTVGLFINLVADWLDS